MNYLKNTKESQKGQAIAELLVAFLVLTLLTLGTVQMALMYKWKSTFNNATFYAAREGALHNAYLKNMYEKLDEAMTPLYLRSEPDANNYALALEKVKAMSSQVPINQARISRIEIISPTESIFESFMEDEYFFVNDEEYGDTGNKFESCEIRNGARECHLLQIPNDNLSFRDGHSKRVDVGGQYIEMNLQDANLLKIRAHWCYEMVVPVVNKVIYESVNLFMGNNNPQIRNCQTLTLASGVNGHYFIPISSDIVLRMQSPVRCERVSIFGSAGSEKCNNLKS